MFQHFLYENIASLWPTRKGKGRLLAWLTRLLSIKPYDEIRYRQVGRYRLHLDPGDLNDRLYYFDLIGSGYCWLLKRLLDAGDTVIDIGANVGYFAAAAADCVGDSGKVYAVEANPQLARRLQKMAFAVSDGPIMVTEAAVWRESGTVTLQIDKKWSGWASLVANATFSADVAIDVAAITIDDLVAVNGIETVRLLKLDIEGAETDALIGASTLLGNHQVDLIQLETEPFRMQAFGHSGRELTDLLTSYDYSAIGVIENEVVRVLKENERIPGSVVGDYIFAHHSIANEIIALLFGDEPC